MGDIEERGLSKRVINEHDEANDDNNNDNNLRALETTPVLGLYYARQLPNGNDIQRNSIGRMKDIVRLLLCLYALACYIMVRDQMSVVPLGDILFCWILNAALGDDESFDNTVQHATTTKGLAYRKMFILLFGGYMVSNAVTLVGTMVGRLLVTSQVLLPAFNCPFNSCLLGTGYLHYCTMACVLAVQFGLVVMCLKLYKAFDRLVHAQSPQHTTHC